MINMLFLIINKTNVKMEKVLPDQHRIMLHYCFHFKLTSKCNASGILDVFC